MTRDEFLDVYSAGRSDAWLATLRRDLDSLLAQAKAAERERCAKEADTWASESLARWHDEGLEQAERDEAHAQYRSEINFASHLRSLPAESPAPKHCPCRDGSPWIHAGPCEHESPAPQTEPAAKTLALADTLRALGLTSSQSEPSRGECPRCHGKGHALSGGWYRACPKCTGSVGEGD